MLYEQQYKTYLTTDLNYAMMLAEAGNYFLENQLPCAEPFYLKSFDIQSKYYGSKTNLNLCPIIIALSDLYYKLENYALSQLYAKKALQIAFAYNDWQLNINAVCDALIHYFYASKKLNAITSMQYAYIAMINFANLVQQTYPNGLSYPLKCESIIAKHSQEPDLQNLQNVTVNIDDLSTDPTLSVFRGNSHYVKAKMFKLAKGQQVTIQQKSRFFSPSQHATPDQPEGPFSDYYCVPGDELSDLCHLVNQFSIS